MSADSRKEKTLAGENFFRTLFRLLQTVKIHQPDNPLLLDCVKEFVDVVRSSGEEESLTLQVSRGQFYLQEEKLVSRAENQTFIQEMLNYFGQRCLPGLRFHLSVRRASPGQIVAFARLLNQAERHE
ncbi:MAG: hypothetical protein Q8P12_00885, partial [bacterium]|nr:hypothetical protein [bacterium]